MGIDPSGYDTIDDYSHMLDQRARDDARQAGRVEELAKLKQQLAMRKTLNSGYKEQQREYGAQYNRYNIYSPYYKYAYLEKNAGLSRATIISRRNYYKQKVDLANNGFRKSNDAIKDLENKIRCLENEIETYRVRRLGEDTDSTTFVDNPNRDNYGPAKISLELLKCIQTLEKGEAADLDKLTPDEKKQLMRYSDDAAAYYYSQVVTAGTASGYERNFKDLTEKQQKEQYDKMAALQVNYTALADYLNVPDFFNTNIYSNKWDNGVFSGSVSVTLGYSDTTALGKTKVELVKFGDKSVGFMFSGKVSLLNAQLDLRLGGENLAVVNKYDIDLFTVSGSASLGTNLKDGAGLNIGTTASVAKLSAAIGAEINGYEATVGGQLDILTGGTKIVIGLIPGSDEIFKITPPGTAPVKPSIFVNFSQPEQEDDGQYQFD